VGVARCHRILHNPYAAAQAPHKDMAAAVGWRVMNCAKNGETTRPPPLTPPRKGEGNIFLTRLFSRAGSVKVGRSNGPSPH
jgi:hypothetical protein